MFSIDTAREFLKAADVFFDNDETPLCLSMNDVWGWACADGEEVSDEELPRVAELFWWYGYGGLLYWASERNQQCKSEFAHINRFIEFVRNEERIRIDEPNSSKRAYLKQEYVIGK